MRRFRVYPFLPRVREFYVDRRRTRPELAPKMIALCPIMASYAQVERFVPEKGPAPDFPHHEMVTCYFDLGLTSVLEYSPVMPRHVLVPFGVCCNSHIKLHPKQKADVRIYTMEPVMYIGEYQILLSQEVTLFRFKKYVKWCALLLTTDSAKKISSSPWLHQNDWSRFVDDVRENVKAAQ